MMKNESSVLFMKSLLEQFNKKGSLSDKQIYCISQKEKEYDPTLLASANSEMDKWSKEYDTEKKEAAKKIAEWYQKVYTDQTGEPRSVAPIFYYERTAKKVLSDPNYIPSRVDYDRMVNNKFAKRFLENSTQAHKFKPGNIVKIATPYKSRFGYMLPHETGLIITVDAAIRNVKDGHILMIIPTGTDQTILIEARFCKLDRN